MLKLNRSLVLVILSLLMYACEKELSLEGVTGGTATFTFSGAPGACTNAVVTGNYQPGTALGSTNVVTVPIDVAVAGTYSVSTATLNGISFSGTGSFTTTGPQTLTLTGTGTPTAAGTFSYTPGTNGCSFIVIVGGGGGGNAVFTFNGAPNACASFTPAGTYTAGVLLTAANFVTVNVNVTTPGTYTITTASVNGVSFSGSGTFAAAGAQVVQLAGSGTPTAAGTFSYLTGTGGCSFSIPVTAASTPAVFTYAGAPDTCTSGFASEIFTVGTPLTASSTITIGVNVTTIGTYTITTPPVNGMTFAATGSFTTPGVQNVTLVGSGTPVADGVFDFVPTNGCLFPIAVYLPTTPGDFLRCTIDGVARTFNITLGGGYINANATNFVVLGYENNQTVSPSFGILLVDSPSIRVATYTRPTLTNQSAFSFGIYSDGVSNTSWASGTAGQANDFTVNITNFTANKIEGTFTGTIYNNDGSGTTAKNVTAGQFSVTY